MNLYEINAALEQAYEEAVDPETGEVIENAAYAAIDGLQMELEEKTENVLLWIKNLQADAEALKKEKMAFADRQAEWKRKPKALRSMSVAFSTGRSSRRQGCQHHGESQKRLSMLAMCLHCRKIISSILIQLWTRQH